MDRDPDAFSGATAFSFRRLWLTLAIAAAIITVGSLAVRMFPNSGYQAGRDAVMDRGMPWVQGEVDAAQGTALTLCDTLYRDTETSESSPRYEYESFVDGCDEAVDDVLGRDVPLLPGGR